MKTEGDKRHLSCYMNTRLPKFRPLSSPPKAAYLPVTSYIFSKSIVLYLLNIQNLRQKLTLISKWADFTLPLIFYFKLTVSENHAALFFYSYLFLKNSAHRPSLCAHTIKHTED